MVSRKKKGMVAWLVTWEWAGEHAKRDDKIAAILSPRWSAERVRKYVEFIYINSYYTLSERAAYAKNPKSNPYPAEFNKVNGVSWLDRISCGHNPHLFARLVDDLVVTEEADGEEKATWKDRPLPDFDAILRRFGIKPHGQEDPA